MGPSAAQTLPDLPPKSNTEGSETRFRKHIGFESALEVNRQNVL